MTLSDLTIKNPVLAWMILIGIVVFGLLSYAGLGISNLPDVDFPVLTISTDWPGAAPDVVETSVTDPIEAAVLGVEGVIEMTSSSTRGNSSVTVYFDLTKNVNVALLEVQAKISQAQRFLPADIYPPVLSKSNPDDIPIIWLAVTGDMDRNFIMEYTNAHLVDRFTTIPGVSTVMMGGYLAPAFRIWLDPDKMQKKEIVASDVINAVVMQHQEVPAGFIDNGEKQITVRVPGEATSTDQFTKIVIPSRGGTPVWNGLKLGEVSNEEDGLQDTINISRSNGKFAVGLGIVKQPGVNAVEVAHAIKKRMEEVQKYLPKGMKLAVRFDTTRFIEDNASDMRFVLIISVLLTALVCWLFLGSFSSAINIFLTIPMSICGAFFVIKMMGFTLNTFTFLGLSLVIGIVVDDAIMVLENITRHREEGETRIGAALKGSREITFAALAATLAILAIFLPVIFMQGVIGKYFFQFGITISSAVAISLLGALTITPMFCSQFLKSHKETGKKPFMDVAMDGFRDWYVKALTWCLSNRWKVIIAAFALFFTSLVLFGLVKKEFVPSQDQSLISVNIQTPVGTSIEFTDNVMKKIEKFITDNPNVVSYYAYVRMGSAFMSVTLKQMVDRPVDPKMHRKLTQNEIMSVLRQGMKAIPGVLVVGMQDLSQMGFTAKRGNPIEFVLIGDDWDKLADIAAAMKDDMEKSGTMVDADTDYKKGALEAVVIPDMKKAAAHGVTVANIGNSVNYLFGEYQVAKWTKNGKRYYVEVELKDDKRNSVDFLNRQYVRNMQGDLVKLSDVATVQVNPAVLSITRENRERAIRIFANIAPTSSQGEALKVVQDLAKKLPEGYRISLTGGSQAFTDSFKSLWIALILGIFVAYMVLGSQFNSFLHPVTVLLALPFSMSGAFIALFVSGKTLNIYSVIGLILLMGIVKKNSILLVDFTNQRREHGMNLRDALLNACPIRLRPIIMTSTATIAAAIPSALAVGHGAETRVPMAIVVIGGVIFSTMLTLFVVPCAYSLFAVFENVKHQKEVHEVMKELADDEKARLDEAAKGSKSKKLK